MLADQREAYNHIISITKKEVRIRRHSLFSKATMYFMARFNCCWTSWRVAGLSIQVQNRASTQFERGEKIQKNGEKLYIEHFWLAVIGFSILYKKPGGPVKKTPSIMHLTASCPPIQASSRWLGCPVQPEHDQPHLVHQPARQVRRQHEATRHRGFVLLDACHQEPSFTYVEL